MMEQICWTIIFFLSPMQQPIKSQSLHPSQLKTSNKNIRMWWMCNELIGVEANLELLDSPTQSA